MPIQFQNFTPNDQKHYTLAEMQSEKDATLQRAMAQDAANNAARSADHAMSIDSSNQQHAALLAQNAKQAGVENGLNQQRINGDNTRVGLANAREMEKTRADVAQNNITNKRQAFADQNTLQQQGLTNARTAKENTQKDAEYQRKLAIENQQSFFNNMGTHVLLGDGANNIDVSGMKQDFSNMYGDVIPKDGALSLNKNKAGGWDLMGVANGQATQLQSEGNPLSYSQHVLDMFASSVKASMFGDKGNIDIKTDPNTGTNTGWDKKGNQVKLNTLDNQELNNLNKTTTPATNDKTQPVNSDNVNALTGQTPVANTNAPPANAGLGRMYKSTDANGVTSYSNKAPATPSTVSTPVPANNPAPGLASQVTAPAVQTKQPTTSQLLAKEQAQQQSVKAQKVINTLNNKLNKTEAEQAQLDKALQTVRNYRSTANNVQ
jgi:hypothetical protein